MNRSTEQDYAEERGQLGFHALLQGDYATAAGRFSEAIEHLRAQANAEIYYALCLDGLGQARIGEQLFAKAEAPLEEALALYENVFVDDSFGKFSVLCHLGLAASRQQAYGRAQMFYEQALAIGETALRDQPLVLAHGCLEGYADALRGLNREGDAKLLDERVKAIFNAAKSKSEPEA
jgi:tetratricopeptide (TPR) repeat protein